MSNDNNMKAAVYYKYGSPDVLRVTEIQKPVPKDNEVLIKIHAASVNACDWHLLRAAPFFPAFNPARFRRATKYWGRYCGDSGSSGWVCDTVEGGASG